MRRAAMRRTAPKTAERAGGPWFESSLAAKLTKELEDMQWEGDEGIGTSGRGGVIMRRKLAQVAGELDKRINLSRRCTKCFESGLSLVLNTGKLGFILNDEDVCHACSQVKPNPVAASACDPGCAPENLGSIPDFAPILATMPSFKAEDGLPILTLAEEMMISRANCRFGVHTVRHGGVRYKGQCIFFPIDTQELHGLLPQHPDSIPLMIVREKDVPLFDIGHVDFIVRAPALEIWVKYKRHTDRRNYGDVAISEAILTAFTEAAVANPVESPDGCPAFSVAPFVRSSTLCEQDGATWVRQLQSAKHCTDVQTAFEAAFEVVEDVECPFEVLWDALQGLCDTDSMPMAELCDKMLLHRDVVMQGLRALTTTPCCVTVAMDVHGNPSGVCSPKCHCWHESSCCCSGGGKARCRKHDRYFIRQPPHNVQCAYFSLTNVVGELRAGVSLVDFERKTSQNPDDSKKRRDGPWTNFDIMTVASDAGLKVFMVNETRVHNDVVQFTRVREAAGHMPLVGSHTSVTLAAIRKLMKVASSDFCGFILGNDELFHFNCIRVSSGGGFSYVDSLHEDAPRHDFGEQEVVDMLHEAVKKEDKVLAVFRSVPEELVALCTFWKDRVVAGQEPEEVVDDDDIEDPNDGTNLGSGTTKQTSVDDPSNMRYELVPSLCTADTAEDLAASMGFNNAPTAQGEQAGAGVNTGNVARDLFGGDAFQHDEQHASSYPGQGICGAPMIRNAANAPDVTVTVDTTAPLSLYNADIVGLVQLAFPTLVHNIHFDFFQDDIPEASMLKHLMAYTDAKGHKPFAEHPTFKYAFLNIIWRRKTNRSKWGLVARSFQGTSVNDFKDQIKNGNTSLLRDVNAMLSQIPGTKMFWWRFKKQCEAFNYWCEWSTRDQTYDLNGVCINGDQQPTVFFTVSAADAYWPVYHTQCVPADARINRGVNGLEANLTEDSYEDHNQRARRVRSHVCAAVQYFHLKFQLYLNVFLRGCFKLTKYFWREEFQAREAGHMHGAGTCEGAPPVAVLQRACDYFQQFDTVTETKTRERLVGTPELFPELFQCVQNVLGYCNDVLGLVASFPQFCACVKKKNHNKKGLKTHVTLVGEDEWDQRYSEILSEAFIHRHSRTYCLRLRKHKSTQDVEYSVKHAPRSELKCRFSVPFAHCMCRYCNKDAQQKGHPLPFLRKPSRPCYPNPKT
jgi:hypothetical protein